MAGEASLFLPVMVTRIHLSEETTLAPRRDESTTVLWVSKVNCCHITCTVVSTTHRKSVLSFLLHSSAVSVALSLEGSLYFLSHECTFLPQVEL